MTTIIRNQAASPTFTLRSDGQPVAIAAGSSVTAQLFNIVTGAPLFTPAKVIDPAYGWEEGAVTVPLTSDDTAAAPVPEAMLVVLVDGKPYRFRVLVEASATAVTRSALFIRDFVVDEIRADRLYALANNQLPTTATTDDYIWSKVLAAESDISHTLRVRLAPTAFFPLPPTQEQIDALNGMPWAEDPAYDYDPEMFGSERWGFIQARNYPLISVQGLRYAYPTAEQTAYQIPLEWLKMDKKYGQIRIVPTGHGSTVLLNSYLLQLLGAGRHIPHMLQLTYVAGLADAARDYPELLDAIKKLAVVKIIEDNCVPQSGSISGDGLSQSFSSDVSKYHDTVDRILNGPPGANGGLMAAIHGVRMGVV